jgi:pSer/pThr/pTyr-binding forkhead associated (FHA) protein/DNA-binding HxlR family transcriptional regulator
MSEFSGDETMVLQQDPDFLEGLSEYLDVLSSSTRLKILKSIERKPKDVREISSEIQTSYENTKKHLDKLLHIGVIRKEAGFGKPTAKGVHPVWKYSLVPGGLEAIVRNLGLFSNIKITLADDALRSRLDQVKGMVSGELAGSAPVLILLGGDDDGRIFPLQGDCVVIGRDDPSAAGSFDPETDVVLSDAYGAVTRISKPHARISRRGEDWLLEDCGSTGGTSVNNAPLQVRNPIPLNDGDLIDLSKGTAGARLVFTVPRPTDEL